ncbi:MAG: polysaccharide biosynthesis/export family protein [Chromatiales bacterium]|nr:MAG: polysaccharide biosynthesis/export family protein [Chromatiales bacterium]
MNQRAEWIKPAIVAANLLVLVICPPVYSQDSGIAPYTINPGDLLSVTVWKEEDLQRQVLVRPDGAFSFPLAGEIQATGQSVEDIRTELVKRLSEYIPDPVVTVATESIQGNKVYVIGQVNRPGEFIAAARIDVVQALSIAGGFTPFAQKNDVRILRRRPDGVLDDLSFRYGEVEKGRNLGQNLILEPGDVIIVP